jgi:hypothetical protein
MASAMPRNSESDPSVTMSGGSFSRVMSSAFNASGEPHADRERGRTAAGMCQSRAAPKTTADRLAPRRRTIDAPVMRIGVRASRADQARRST